MPQNNVFDWILGINVIWLGLFLFIIVTWIFLPFAIFGFQKKLSDIAKILRDIHYNQTVLIALQQGKTPPPPANIKPPALTRQSRVEPTFENSQPSRTTPHPKGP